MTAAAQQKPGVQVVALPGKGRGVIAAAAIAKGDTVIRGRMVSMQRHRDATSFQVRKCLHVQLDEPARLLNHACAGWNLAVRDNAFCGYDFLAVRAIAPGEELTWHYGMTEAESIAVPPGRCRCGSPACDGKSLGYRQLASDQQRRLYADGIARYLYRQEFCIWCATNGYVGDDGYCHSCRTLRLRASAAK